jgi:hypothetical protein
MRLANLATSSAQRVLNLKTLDIALGIHGNDLSCLRYLIFQFTKNLRITIFTTFTTLILLAILNILTILTISS